MIAIINYGQNRPDILIDALSQITDELIFTENENEIAKADKIIFHSEDSPEILIKKLHFENLFSLLRLCHKPLLAIGTSFTVCGEKIISSNQVGLGLTPYEVAAMEKEVSGYFRINISGNNKLFEGVKEQSYYFSSKSFISENENTSSTIIIDEKKYSASLNKDKFTGLQFYPEKSSTGGIVILHNWYNLH